MRRERSREKKEEEECTNLDLVDVVDGVIEFDRLILLGLTGAGSPLLGLAQRLADRLRLSLRHVGIVVLMRDRRRGGSMDRQIVVRYVVRYGVVYTSRPGLNKQRRHEVNCSR